MILLPAAYGIRFCPPMLEVASASSSRFPLKEKLNPEVVDPPKRFEAKSKRSIIRATPAIPAFISRCTPLLSSFTELLRASSFSLRPCLLLEIDSLYLAEAAASLDLMASGRDDASDGGEGPGEILEPLVVTAGDAGDGGFAF